MGDRGAISARCYGGSTTNRAPGQVADLIAWNTDQYRALSIKEPLKRADR